MTTDSELEEKELQGLVASSEAGSDVADDYIDIDLSEAVDYSAWAEKGIQVEVVAASRAVAKDSGKTYIKLQLKVVSGEYENRRLFENINLSGKGASMGRLTLEALQADIDWEHPRIRCEDLLGLTATVDAYIRHQDGYKDSTNAKNWRISAATEVDGTLK